MSEIPYFSERLYWFTVIALDIVLSGTFGIMLAYMFTSGRLTKHNSNNTGKSFADNCSGKLGSYDHLACKELFNQTPEVYEKRRQANRESLKEENLEYFKKNMV